MKEPEREQQIGRAVLRLVRKTGISLEEAIAIPIDLVCEACGSRYPAGHEPCPICGSWKVVEALPSEEHEQE